jgi:hypothetical protein
MEPDKEVKAMRTLRSGASAAGAPCGGKTKQKDAKIERRIRRISIIVPVPTRVFPV